MESLTTYHLKHLGSPHISESLVMPCVVVAMFTLMQAIIVKTFGYTPYPDSEGYIYLAKECVEHREFYPVGALIDEYPFVWNLGAINAVALALFAFGSFTPLLYFYALLKGATAGLTYLIAKEAFGPRIAFAALIIYVCYPANYGESTSLLSEIPFIFFGLLSIYLGIKRCPFLAGVLLVMANYFRPLAVIFVFPLLIYYIDQHRLSRSVSAKYLIGIAMMLLIIGGTNYLKTGYFITQAKSGWMVLRDYSLDHANDQVFEASSIAENTSISQIEGLNCVEADAVFRRQFIDWLKSNPATYIKQMPMKIVRTYASDNANFCAFLPNKDASYLYSDLSLPSLVKEFPHYSAVQALTAINLLYYYGLMVMFVLALLRLFKTKHYAWLLFCMSVPLIGTLILVLVGHGEGRYHVPFMPFIIMAAAIGICQATNHARRPTNNTYTQASSTQTNIG